MITFLLMIGYLRVSGSELNGSAASCLYCNCYCLMERRSSIRSSGGNQVAFLDDDRTVGRVPSLPRLKGAENEHLE